PSLSCSWRVTDDPGDDAPAWAEAEESSHWARIAHGDGLAARVLLRYPQVAFSVLRIMEQSRHGVGRRASGLVLQPLRASPCANSRDSTSRTRRPGWAARPRPGG